MTVSLQRREKWIFAIAAGFIVLFAVDKLAVRGKAGAEMSLSQRIQREEAALARDNRLIRDRKEILKAYGVLSGRTGSRASKAEGTRLLSDLETLARQNGMTLKGLKPTPSKRSDLFSAALLAEGDWAAASAFVLALEDPSLGLRVGEADIKLKSSEARRVEVRLALSRPEEHR